jgi:hypothetical protein
MKTYKNYNYYIYLSENYDSLEVTLFGKDIEDFKYNSNISPYWTVKNIHNLIDNLERLKELNNLYNQKPTFDYIDEMLTKLILINCKQEFKHLKWKTLSLQEWIFNLKNKQDKNQNYNPAIWE